MAKTALITGASRGIGKAIAIDLAKKGYNTVINFRGNENLAQEVVQECLSFGVKSVKIQADVCNYSQCEKMVEEALAVFGAIDVLVNNAGIVSDGLLMRMSEEQFSNVIVTNLNSVFNMCKLVSKPMMKQRSGKIINISSIVGITGNAGQCNYSSAKAGVIAFTKSLSKELGKRGINVNAVAPGFIKTDMTASLNDEIAQKMLDTISLNRFGNTEDIAGVVSFLAGESANYITGQVIVVDGGMS